MLLRSSQSSNFNVVYYMYTADTVFAVSALSFCLFGFFWKPTEHISMLSVTLWGDLTAVNTAALSFDSGEHISAAPKVRDIVRQKLCPLTQRDTPASSLSYTSYIGVSPPGLLSPGRFLRKYPYPNFHRLQGWLPLLTCTYLSLANFKGRGVQRSRLTSSSPVIGIWRTGVSYIQLSKYKEIYFSLV